MNSDLTIIPSPTKTGEFIVHCNGERIGLLKDRGVIEVWQDNAIISEIYPDEAHDDNGMLVKAARALVSGEKLRVLYLEEVLCNEGVDL